MSSSISLPRSEHYDVAVIGAGAAGLMAAIAASCAGARVVAIDGAKKIGAKILISGGGRCNVTNEVVRAEDFNGSRNAIAKVLRTFDVSSTVAFFEELGVKLKREETGKLFPISNRARDVVDALLRAAEGVEIVTGIRVESIESGFVINGSIHADRVILAAGGRSVPMTGSDGSGYTLARMLGHTVTPAFPALVPLVVEKGHWITELSGISVDAELAVKSPTGRVLQRHRGSMLFTHFGLSGPVVLDISRHWIANQPATLSANFLPGETFESVDAALIAAAKRNPHATIGSVVRLPDRLLARLTPETALGRLSKDDRRRLVRDLVDYTLPVVRDRGFEYAEVTAGGVPLSEIDVGTMESRICPNLYLCGEILDVDGRIGGFNFQWAWASGRLAGLSASGR
ncbi:MAG: NAD(P)/FAD-dependent oxidoreductase [Acidobacteria bacterium]|nr:NAD(P)/FAD-dependent oxidoreductase [Acidobacteriota bacterium]MBV9069372.1 NAD(P)/FAD-dependent oxidoreductase [Acidobacteriota bacterium]MBV9185722.1 NAD(P)/FAD-dependent oxidoreductase [Acidobacteriota bacterium]